ncbi:hypothetical protein A2311_01890 [candidate division WOR-1 bacterium RIFOXYB2_FULL_48_7]|uniref:CBM-cenC domain-containing protein n=1 Tax=candidate division WOR-1 bacterium RIFOXYB2_FULL_48_7 TaxID=1802583 RepID=A0A1F4TPZ4_UNCSA|nr:MAG: hypothetical protein A2311_01890 [candidate division WOR-1 bacterium RIFOXYB2_FULL_48_7]
MLAPLQPLLARYRQLFQNIVNYFRFAERTNLPRNLLLLATGYYIVVFSLYSIYNHALYSTGTHDVGVYDQIIWLISQFCWPVSTLGGGSLFTFHVSGNCYFLAPLFWFWDNVTMLYIAQTAFLAGAVWPLYLYARKKTDHAYLPLAIGLAYLLYPALQGMNLENFHPEVISIFFLAWTYYFLTQKQYAYYYPLAFVSLLGKEDISLTIAFLGLYLIFLKKEKKVGLITFLMGGIYFLLATRVIMPWANAAIIPQSSQLLIYSHWFGGLSNNLFNFSYYWQSIFNWESFRYLNQLLAPLLYLPLFSPVALLCLPQLLVNILSRCGYFMSIYYHYNYAVTIFAFYAFVDSVVWLKLRLPVQWRAALWLPLIIILTAIIGNLSLSGLPMTQQWPTIIDKISQSKSLTCRYRIEALKLIPPSASLSVSYSLFPHLSHRHRIYHFPNPFRAAYWIDGLPLPPIAGHADYVILIWDRLSEEERLIARFLLASDFYQTVPNKSDLLILKRVRAIPKTGHGAKYLTPFQAGEISSLYFPDSPFFLRNILGDNIPVSNGLALQIEGYIFLDQSGLYGFSLDPPQTYLEIDGRPTSRTILQRGFHRYHLKLTQSRGPWRLKMLVYPPFGRPYIPSDKQLVSENNPAVFRQVVAQFDLEANKQTALLKSQNNLIINGSFEKTYGVIPQDWSLESWVDKDANCLAETDPNIRQNGARSVKLINQGLVDARWVQEVYLQPNKSYRLSGWIKTVDVARRGEGALLLVEGSTIRTTPIFGTQDWQFVEATGKTGPDQQVTKVECRLGYFGAPNSGQAYFDNLVLKEVPPEY